jgi:phosphate starvation-inducible PhoH-like protein
LVEAIDVLGDVRGLAFTRFSSADVVRHPLVARIVDAYDEAKQPKKSAPAKKATKTATKNAAK